MTPRHTRRWHRARALCLIGCLGAAMATRAAPAEPGPTPYLVGVGISDITGEAADIGMFGYGQFTQRTSGIHQRLRARAFVIEDARTHQAAVLVVADAGAIMQGVQQAVLRRLQQAHGQRYTDRNVLLTATHTHAGPGGYSHHTLYNITVLGPKQATFDAMVDGIVEAIGRAHDSRAPGSIRLSQGDLTDASRNRAAPAFAANPVAERQAFPQGIDPLMSVLTFRQGTRDIGALSLFPTHGTSMTNANTLISGDNKGYAAWRWEHEAGVKHLDHATSPPFVAAFAQTNPGDMSPNLALQPGRGPTANEFDNTRLIGERQLIKARQLFKATGHVLNGPIDHRLRYVDMSQLTVQPPYSGDGQAHRTCPAALGTAFTAGSPEDGPGLSWVHEGKPAPWLARVGRTLFSISDALRQCQAPKEIAIPLGADTHGTPWTPEVLPVQLMRLGPLFIAALPGEPTITAGLRIRRQLAATLGLSDPRQVLVVGYANAYAGYITTPQEYDTQNYEGGSTHFGRWTLPAYIQELDRLAQDMKAGRDTPITLRPRDLQDHGTDVQPGVLLDTPALGHAFGDVLEAPHASYQAGQTVRVVFSSGSPRNHLRRGDSYLEIQRQAQDRWVRVADDGDWSTIYRWERSGPSSSTASIEWTIPAGTPPGRYRIVHHGDAKGWDGEVKAFTGTSPSFHLR